MRRLETSCSQRVSFQSDWERAVLQRVGGKMVYKCAKLVKACTVARKELTPESWIPICHNYITSIIKTKLTLTSTSLLCTTFCCSILINLKIMQWMHACQMTCGKVQGMNTYTWHCGSFYLNPADFAQKAITKKLHKHAQDAFVSKIGPSEHIEWAEALKHNTCNTTHWHTHTMACTCNLPLSLL